jgi:hypothetical protein
VQCTFQSGDEDTFIYQKDMNEQYVKMKEATWTGFCFLSAPVQKEEKKGVARELQ